MQKPSSAFVTGIRVRSLFGMYDYTLGSYDKTESFQPGLIIFYGDNGIGKTTLLRLVYHLLSKETDRGHRSMLARIPFNSLSVMLNNGTEVGIQREARQLRGDYKLYVKSKGKEEISCHGIFNAEHDRVDPAPNTQAHLRWDLVMKALADLNIAMYYLPDNRRLDHQGPQQGQVDVDLSDVEIVLHSEQREVFTQRKRRRRSVLQSAIADLEELMRQEALNAANTGEANINLLYLDVAKRVLRAKGSSLPASKTKRGEFAASLRALVEQSKPFVKLGLMPDLDFVELIKHATASSISTQRTLSTVMQPYIESVTARLTALRPIQQLIDSFVGSLNGFYTQKYVVFDLKNGFRIFQVDGSILPPDALSSGEQQLLLLFCNTVRARSQATIFIIDEPELSLNVKWQRRLLGSLLALVAGSSVQFVIATHSVELMAAHRSGLVRLLPKVTSK